MLDFLFLSSFHNNLNPLNIKLTTGKFEKVLSQNKIACKKSILIEYGT